MKKLEYEYFKKLVSHIKVLFDRNEYSNHFYIGQLLNSIYSISTNESIKSNILESIESNHYFFLCPLARLAMNNGLGAIKSKSLLKKSSNIGEKKIIIMIFKHTFILWKL
ncbi:hypothetical protein [Paenibacillus sp. JNUCC31]|uniref:hypothetical protein n=1 Tax=Paenibacillus sp. JNUCC-31 TaxID=2777983 RepID=UPI001E4C1625|nr:hypothetical protein [Paenibacillus sp. JNUCC-31]